MSDWRDVERLARRRQLSESQGRGVRGSIIEIDKPPLQFTGFWPVAHDNPTAAQTRALSAADGGAGVADDETVGELPE